MKNAKIRKWLSLGALSLFGVFSITKANAQEVKAGRFTQKYCKFINNNTELVENLTDTLRVHKIYPAVYYLLGHNWMVCDVSNGNGPVYELRFNPEYFRTTPWLPPIMFGDTVAFNMIDLDEKLVGQYYDFQNKLDYENRDLIEQKILENRQNLINRSMAQQKERE